MYTKERKRAAKTSLGCIVFDERNATALSLRQRVGMSPEADVAKAQDDFERAIAVARRQSFVGKLEL